MRYYETLYLINPNLSGEDCREVVTKFSDLVENNKGVVVKVDEWGKKTLAYKVKKFDKGYYVLLQYCGQADMLEELKRGLTLDDRVLKYQTIKLSDNADPEALKAEAGEGEAKAGGDAGTTAELNSDKNSESSEKQEGENGLRTQ